MKVLVVAPVAGVYVPAPALNVPPVPVVLTQVPPDCSPVIKLNKSIAEVLESQTRVFPSVPALGFIQQFFAASILRTIVQDFPLASFFILSVMVTV